MHFINLTFRMLVNIHFRVSKRRLHHRKTEHFKALSKHDHSSAIADHVKTTGRNIKWDDFDILAFGKTGYHCKVKDRDLVYSGVAAIVECQSRQ